MDNVVIEGKTLVNIGKTITKNVGNDAIRTRFEGNGDDYRSRYSNNTFTLINYTDKVISFPTMSKDNTSWSTQYDVQPNSRIAVQIPNDASLVGVDYWNINGWTLSNDTVINDSFFAILEGDHTDKPISYFEGLKSVGQGDKIEVLSYNKANENLIKDTFTYTKDMVVDCINGEFKSASGHYACDNYIEIEPSTDYMFIGINANRAYYDENKQVVLPINNSYLQVLLDKTNGSKKNFAIEKTPSTAKYVRVTIHKDNLIDGKAYLYKNSNYDHKQISTTLRSLPNGVKDTIEKRGNKYVKVQRCKEEVLNQNSNVTGIYKPRPNGVESQTYIRCQIALSSKPKTSAQIYCDSISSKHDYEAVYKNIFVNGDEYQCAFLTLPVSELNSLDGIGVKTWLSSNPITVVYELETPIITELPNFNPQTFSDKTTLLLNSGVVQGEASFEVTNSLGSELEVLKNKVSDLDNYVVDEEVYYPTLLNGFSQVHFNDNNFIKKIGNMCFMNLVFRNTSNVQDGTLICKLPLNFKSKNVTRVVSIGDILNANIDINENNILIYPSSKNISNVPFRVNCCWEVD